MYQFTNITMFLTLVNCYIIKLLHQLVAFKIIKRFQTV